MEKKTALQRKNAEIEENDKKNNTMVENFKKKFPSPDSPEKFMREFFLMTPKTAYCRFHSNNEYNKKEILKIINNENNKLLSIIFFMAIQSNRDVNQEILKSNEYYKCCYMSSNGEQHINSRYKDAFLCKPIGQSFMNYSLLFEIHNSFIEKINNCQIFIHNRKEINEVYKDLKLTVSDIDGLPRNALEAIISFNSNRKEEFLNYQQIKTLYNFFSMNSLNNDKVGRIKNIIKQKISFFYYYSYKGYTKKNLTIALNESFYGPFHGAPRFIIKSLLTLIVSASLSRLIAITFCKKTIIEEIVNRNNRSIEFNKLLALQFCDFLSENQKSLQDPLQYSKKDQLSIFLPSLLPFGVVLLRAIKNHNDTDNIEEVFMWASHIIGGTLFTGICHSLNRFLLKTTDNHYMFFISSIILVASIGAFIFFCIEQNMQIQRLNKINWDNTIGDILQKHENGEIKIE